MNTWYSMQLGDIHENNQTRSMVREAFMLYLSASNKPTFLAQITQENMVTFYLPPSASLFADTVQGFEACSDIPLHLLRFEAGDYACFSSMQSRESITAVKPLQILETSCSVLLLLTSPLSNT